MRLLCFAALLMLLSAHSAGAQTIIPPGSPDRERILKEVRLEQHMNAEIPGGLHFIDENGAAVEPADYWRKKPLMLMMIQFRCRMLCTQQIEVLLHSMRQLQFTPGKEFDLAIVSIDPREGPELARDIKANFMERYGRAAAADGVHFLSGDSESIARLAGAVGLHYVWDQGTDQFAHPDGVMLITPAGRVSRYYFRLSYPERDLRLGLVEAASGKIGTPLDAFALLCYHYSPLTGKYSLSLMKTVKVAAVATILLLIAMVSLLSLRYRTQRIPDVMAHSGS